MKCNECADDALIWIMQISSDDGFVLFAYTNHHCKTSNLHSKASKPYCRLHASTFFAKIAGEFLRPGDLKYSGMENYGVNSEPA